MTAGSWIYHAVVSGIVQGTCETFAELGNQHASVEICGHCCLTARSLGGMGGAQPLAVL